MKYLELLFWAIWGSFLISEATGIPSNGQHHLSDLNKRDVFQADFKCPLVFGVFSDPNDCSHYYVCVAGVAVHKKCGFLQHFDIFRRTCLPAFIAICGGNKDKSSSITPSVTTTTVASSPTGDSFECPSMIGSYPYPGDCSKYYRCMLYRHSLKTCPEKELFDAVKNKCKREREVNCGTRQRPGFTTTAISTVSITEISTEIPTEPKTESITTKTSIEITESITEMETESTTEEVVTDPPETTTEDIITKTYWPTGPPEHNCDEDDVDCIITETGDVEDWFICPQDVGSYPHPSSDKLFIFCMNWVPSVKKCGMDLVFSKELSTCVELKHLK